MCNLRAQFSFINLWKYKELDNIGVDSFGIRESKSINFLKEKLISFFKTIYQFLGEDYLGKSEFQNKHK